MSDNVTNKLINVTTSESLQVAVEGRGGDGTNNNNNKHKVVLLFGTTWHESCITLRTVLEILASEKTDVVFGYVDAESSPLSDEFGIETVPTVILLNNGAKDKNIHFERLEGGVLEPSQVTLAVQRLVDAPEEEDAVVAATSMTTTTTTTTSSADDSIQTQSSPQVALNDRLYNLIRGDTVMLFMKGTPDQPKCGFSRQAVELLTDHGVAFGTFDILQDDDVRQGLKTYSDWPTYPQIYVKGELIGGLDILKETAAEGPLKEQWEIDDDDNVGTAGGAGQQSLHDRLTSLINRSPTMLFMKGLPSAPQCGFSRQIVEILDDCGVPYDAFNILEDEEVRQGLKEFSDWPTYPQLYHNGELLGGLDIVQELKESGELQETLMS